MFSKPLKELLSAEVEIDDAALISVDSKGTDIRVRQGAQVMFSYCFSQACCYMYFFLSYFQLMR